MIGDWLQLSGDWLVTNCRFSIKTKTYKTDALHNQTISLQVFKMLTTRELQLLRLQRVNQNVAIDAMMVYRQLTRRRRMQYWLRPWIAKRSLFLELLRTILTVDLTSSSTCCEMTLSCADRSMTFVNPSPIDWRTLGNLFATDCRLVGDKAPIDHRLIADQSQIGRHYIAKIPALFVVKPIAAPSETDLRLT